MSIFEACQKADIQLIKSFVDAQGSLYQVDDQGRTVLHYCAEHSTSECIEYLLSQDHLKEKYLDLKDNEGCSPLHLACLNGNALMIKYFLEQGADVRLMDNESHSLIHWITVCGHFDLFDLLIDYHAPIHTADIYGAYPIHYAAQLSGIESNDEMKIDPEKGLGFLKKLVEYDVDINCLDEQKRTPFLWAASVGAIDALRILHQAGANAQHVDKDSLNAIHCVVTRGHSNCIRTLVESYQCPLEGVDVNGCTALFYAITLQNNDACRILLDLHANVNHQDNRGRTPSHCAALKGNFESFKYLLQHHADVWIRNKRGDFPLHEAIGASVLDKNHLETFEKRREIVRYIFKYFPKRIECRNGEQRTSLHLAASLGDVSMCDVLIECGAKVNSFIQTNAGNFITPFDLARIRRQDACADHLMFHHGGQRGNFLAKIYARRIQRSYRKYRQEKSKRVQIRRQSSLAGYSSDAIIRLIRSRDQLFNQAQCCLENKRSADRNRSNSSGYLLLNNDEQRQFDKPRRSLVSSQFLDDPNEKKIIIHRSDSVSTSVKLYERHKFLAEELSKMKHARQQNVPIVIHRPLYKILIENAYNPQDHQPDEIEKYLENLVKAYEVELDGIRKRTKSTPPRRTRHSISITGPQNKIR